jgi:hypothetical protein
MIGQARDNGEIFRPGFWLTAPAFAGTVEDAEAAHNVAVAAANAAEQAAIDASESPDPDANAYYLAAIESANVARVAEKAAANAEIAARNAEQNARNEALKAQILSEESGD